MIAINADASQDILVKVASPISGPSYNFYSILGKYCCSLFACAFVKEL